MQDPFFGKSVVFMCEHDKQGAMGLIVNKPFHELELKESFNEGGIAGDYAQYAYILALMAGSFVIVLLIKALWNRLIPRITNWRKIDYFEAMGIMTIILLLSYI